MTIQRIARPDKEKKKRGIHLFLLFFPYQQSAGDVPFEFLPYQLDGRIEAYHGYNG